MAAWNPSTDLLTILAGNKDTMQSGSPVLENAEFDHSTQGTNSSQGDDPAATRRVPGDRLREGELPDPRVLQAQRARDLQPDHDRRGSGARYLPTFSAFPPLGSLVDGSIYLNPDNAGTFAMTLGPQTG